MIAARYTHANFVLDLRVETTRPFSIGERMEVIIAVRDTIARSLPCSVAELTSSVIARVSEVHHTSNPIVSIKGRA